MKATTERLAQDDNGPMKAWTCGARTRGGHPCRRPGIQPSGRCRLHGGLTPRGAASPHFKHGRYSRYLPTGLAGRHPAVRDDAELVSLRAAVGLLTAHIGELTGRLWGDGSPRDEAVWRALGAAILRKARLVRLEAARLKLLRQYISAPDAHTLIRAIVEVVLWHVPEPETRLKISREITMLISDCSDRGPTSGSPGSRPAP
jgi:hypothetical protein